MKIPWDNVFTPRSVVVVGNASLGKGGWYFLIALENFGYKGEIYCADAQEPTAFPVKWVSKVEDLPHGIEYAIICIKAKLVPDLLRRLAKKGVKAAHIFSSGFAELKTKEGKHLQDEISAIVHETGIRIIGPNCVGPFCPAGTIAPTPGVFPKESGNVGFVSQSGGISQSFIWNGATYGFYLFKAVSVGNCADLKIEDFIQHMADDKDISVMAAYIEGLDDFRLFFDVAKRVTKKKPLVLLKTGKTLPGLTAIGSHTGVLSGEGLLWDYAMRQAGVTLVDTYDELVHTVQAFAKTVPVKGARIGLMNRGGGEGIVATDYLSMLGFEIPEYAKQTQARLREILPSSGTSVSNPIDFAAIGGYPTIFKKILKTAGSDTGIDAIFYQHHVEFSALFAGENMNMLLIQDLIEAASEIDKPVFVVAPLYYSYEAWYNTVQTLNKAKIPVFPSLDMGAKALRHVVHYYSKNRHKGT